MSQVRKDELDNSFDELTYRYHENTGKRLQNRLYHVDDNIASGTMPDDIDDQGTFIPTNYNQSTNYIYDAIGNLEKDDAEDIDNIAWTVTGKVSHITRDGASPLSHLEFKYDPAGNRIMKIVKPAGSLSDPNQWTTTHYVRDASGNLMATYEESSVDFILKERPLYGSSRVGINTNEIDMIAATSGSFYSRHLGKKMFELNNHLGNVLTVVSDKKIPIQVGGSGLIDHYLADVMSVSDYYPFGALIKLRSFNNQKYRYGYGGHEMDDEVKGSGNHISFNDYGLDTRLGRRFGNDPVVNPSVSPYAVFLNNPIFFQDPDGESPISWFVKQVAKTGLKKAAKETIETAVKNRLKAYMNKSWAKQLGKDALDAIDVATSQSWWEYAIEFIPVAGDAYGAAKLGEQGYAVYKITQKFESAIEWSSKAAGRAFKKLGTNNLVDKGADLVTDFTKKFNNQGSHLTEDDLAGAVKEIYGLKSGVKADGTPFQHLKEVQEALGGMGKQIESLKKQISSGAFEGDALKAAQGILNDTQKQYDSINNTLNSAKKAAENL